ncbi:MAG: hypothetical protein P4L42_03570 [Desulfocapsaceae bacterium]|nr:hypothetical protein [Desulfocapsaceae bacterium]
MAIFCGRYSWDGRKTDQREPVAWFPGAYDLRIIDLTEGMKGITFLKPVLCIYTNTGTGYSISEHPERFAKRICSDFSLEIDKVLWVEQLQHGSDSFEIITYKQCGILGGNSLYLTLKRRPLPRELNLIRKGLSA